jgi:hypothetical protein
MVLKIKREEVNEEVLDKGLDKLIKEGYVWALCPHCRMPLDSVDSKKCEICYKPIVKENILFKKLDKENMS